MLTKQSLKAQGGWSLPMSDLLTLLLCGCVALQAASGWYAHDAGIEVAVDDSLSGSQGIPSLVRLPGQENVSGFMEWESREFDDVESLYNLNDFSLLSSEENHLVLCSQLRDSEAAVHRFWSLARQILDEPQRVRGDGEFTRLSVLSAPCDSKMEFRERMRFGTQDG